MKFCSKLYCLKITTSVNVIHLEKGSHKEINECTEYYESQRRNMIIMNLKEEILNIMNLKEEIYNLYDCILNTCHCTKINLEEEI